MSKINDLIKKFCSNGVEYKQLQEIADTFIGLATSVTKHKVSEGVILLHNSDIKQNKIILKNFEFIDKKFADKNKNKYYQFHDIATVHTGDVGTSAVIEEEYAGSMGFTTLVTRIYDFNNVNPYYLCHYFNSQLFKNDVAKVTISDRSNLNQKEFCQLNVPIPPIEVQNEIVRILDKFSELEAKLEAELEARKSQCEFWRAKVLNNDKYDAVSLGDYATFSQGIQINPKDQKDYCDDGMVPFLRIVDFVKNDEPPRYIIKPDNKYMKQENEEMVMIRYGASAAGKVFINKYGAIANNMFKVNLTTDEIDIRYLWHYLSQDKIYKKLNNTGGGSTMPAINFKMAGSIQIVLPPKEEQTRIVQILDKFDALVNDITVGIPAEIELRRQQYEYYRNELLSFKELNANE